MPTEMPPGEHDRLPEPPVSEEAPGASPAPNRDAGSYQIASIAGIPVRLHFTFFLLLIWLAALGAGKPHPWVGLLFFLGLFVCVLLHELGHALVALRGYGVRTRDITLYPIGGVARMERLPRPSQELGIALAGPVVNVLIAGLLYGVLRAAHLPVTNWNLTGYPTHVLSSLMVANLYLAGFNLIPAFPMDGGRILRAALARTMDELSATTLAARVGQFIAFLMGVYGFLAVNVLLMIVAVFVYYGAGQEAAAFQAKTLVMGHRVREAMMREFHTLPVGATLREAADLLLAGSQQDFPILHGGEAVGVLSRSALLRGIAADGYDSYVAGVMQRDFARVQPDDDLEAVLSQGPFEGPILVLANDGGEPALVGMLTQENLIEFLTLTRLQRIRG